MKALYAKLLKIQQEIKAIKKDETNPFFKNKYFDINGLLEELKPVLNANGVVVMQPIATVEGKSVLETLIIDIESGDQIKSFVQLPENIDPQKMGSAITYFRRYSLQSFFLLQAEDDDGNKASEKKENPDKSHAPRPITQPITQNKF